jgi:hypothetical protein
MNLRQRKKPCLLLVAMIILLTMTARLMRADTGTCNGQTVTLPFTDVQGNPFFCAIASAFFSGVTNGTSATTYNPSATVSREQMAAFVSRTLDQSLRRGSQRAALKKFYHSGSSSTNLNIGNCLRLLESDGADVWVADPCDDTVLRVKGSDGKLLQTWTGATQAFGVLAVNGLIFVTGKTTPGKLYKIKAKDSPGPVQVFADTLGNDPEGLAYDGLNIWTANTSGSISRINSFIGSQVTNFSTGFSSPRGILFDGANIWVTDSGDNRLKKVNPSNGNILQEIPVGDNPRYPVFDGTNIWVPNFSSNAVTVVRASTGQVLATLSHFTFNGPLTAAFDGERVVIVNGLTFSASMWKATDLTQLGTFNPAQSTQDNFGVCSDGIRFYSTSSEGFLNLF